MRKYYELPHYFLLPFNLIRDGHSVLPPTSTSVVEGLTIRLYVGSKMGKNYTHKTQPIIKNTFIANLKETAHFYFLLNSLLLPTIEN